MENQKLLLDLDTDSLEHKPNTIPSVFDDEVISEDIKHDYENDSDDLTHSSDNVIVNTEKQQSLENVFESTDQEKSKASHSDDEDIKITNIPKNEEKEHLLDFGPVSNTKVEDLVTLPKIESQEEEEFIPFENIDSKPIDTIKSVKSQENEPVNVVQSEPEIADAPEIISEVSKKDTYEGDVCDIKIGPEELFCRIGLGKIVLFFKYLNIN